MDLKASLTDRSWPISSQWH